MYIGSSLSRGTSINCRWFGIAGGSEVNALFQSGVHSLDGEAPAAVADLNAVGSRLNEYCAKLGSQGIAGDDGGCRPGLREKFDWLGKGQVSLVGAGRHHNGIPALGQFQRFLNSGQRGFLGTLVDIVACRVDKAVYDYQLVLTMVLPFWAVTIRIYHFYRIGYTCVIPGLIGFSFGQPCQQVGFAKAGLDDNGFISRSPALTENVPEVTVALLLLEVSPPPPSATTATATAPAAA